MNRQRLDDYLIKYDPLLDPSVIDKIRLFVRFPFISAKDRSMGYLCLAVASVIKDETAPVLTDFEKNLMLAYETYSDSDVGWLNNLIIIAMKYCGDHHLIPVSLPKFFSNNFFFEYFSTTSERVQHLKDLAPHIGDRALDKLINETIQTLEEDPTGKGFDVLNLIETLSTQFASRGADWITNRILNVINFLYSASAKSKEENPTASALASLMPHMKKETVGRVNSIIKNKVGSPENKDFLHLASYLAGILHEDTMQQVLSQVQDKVNSKKDISEIVPIVTRLAPYLNPNQMEILLVPLRTLLLDRSLEKEIENKKALLKVLAKKLSYDQIRQLLLPIPSSDELDVINYDCIVVQALKFELKADDCRELLSRALHAKAYTLIPEIAPAIKEKHMDVLSPFLDTLSNLTDTPKGHELDKTIQAVATLFALPKKIRKNWLQPHKENLRNTLEKVMTVDFLAHAAQTYSIAEQASMSGLRKMTLDVLHSLEASRCYFSMLASLASQLLPSTINKFIDTIFSASLTKPSLIQLAAPTLKVLFSELEKHQDLEAYLQVIANSENGGKFLTRIASLLTPTQAKLIFFTLKDPALVQLFAPIVYPSITEAELTKFASHLALKGPPKVHTKSKGVVEAFTKNVKQLINRRKHCTPLNLTLIKLTFLPEEDIDKKYAAVEKELHAQFTLGKVIKDPHFAYLHPYLRNKLQCREAFDRAITILSSSNPFIFMQGSYVQALQQAYDFDPEYFALQVAQTKNPDNNILTDEQVKKLLAVPTVKNLQLELGTHSNDASLLWKDIDSSNPLQTISDILSKEITSAKEAEAAQTQMAMLRSTLTPEQKDKLRQDAGEQLKAFSIKIAELISEEAAKREAGHLKS